MTALAAGASEQFRPLQASAYMPFTAIGVLAGAAGWAVVRRRSRRPAFLLRRLVPAVVAVSLLPDLAVYLTEFLPGATGLSVIALSAMHLSTAGITVLILARFLPLPVRH